MSEREVAQKKPAAALSVKEGSALQRKCACGRHTIAGAECEGCGKQKLPRSAAVAQAEPPGVPSVLEEAIASSPGHSLDAGARTFIESRFGHDFSRVAASPQSKLTVSEPGDRFEQEADRLAEQVMRAPRPQSQPQHPSDVGSTAKASAVKDSPSVDFSRVRVHTDERAAKAARAINARAFTLGRDIFFGVGEYAPHESEGRKLLAHELSHVAQQQPQQQSGRDSRGVIVQPKRERIPVLSGIYDFFSNIVQAISSGFAAETLQEYVETIIETAAIEDSFDSDNKALEVYKLWKAGKDKTEIKIGPKSYHLTDKLKSLLAQELRTGSADTEEKQAAQELQDFSLKAAAPAAAAPEATAKVEAPPAAKEESLTTGEKGAAKLRAGLKGQVEIKELRGRKYQVGGVEANAAAQADIKANNVLLNRDDTAHIEFFGRKLGVEISYDTPRDPFRWNTLKEIIATGKADILAVSETAQQDVRESFRGQISPKVKRSLQEVGGRGATAVREELFKIIEASQPSLGISFVSATDRDQVWYSTGFASAAHEFFGHLWLAMNGVPFGHKESLKDTHTIKDPFGEPYTGGVNEYITNFVQESPQRNTRGRIVNPPSSSVNVTDQSFEEALQAFVRAASAKDAFTVSAGRAPSSRAFQDSWQALHRFYVILLTNFGNEGKRLAHITTELKKVYAAYTEDFQEAFDIFFFYKAASLGAITPETHVVRQLEIKDPRQRPQKKGKVQRSAAGTFSNKSLPAIADGAMRSMGQPLDYATRTLMESRFGHDFSRVRVHTDAPAADAAAALQANAYTHERDIYFASGKYQPQTTTGRGLLAHELTHVVQQQAGIHLRDEVSEPGDPYERQADAVADEVMADRVATPIRVQGEATRPAAGTIQRQVKPGSNSVSSSPPSMKDIEAAVAALKARMAVLAAPILTLEAGYRSEKLAQLQLIPNAGQHVHEALAFAFLRHNPDAGIKSMNKDVVGIDVSKVPSWQKPDWGGELFILNLDYSNITSRQLADIKAKRKVGTVIVNLTNAPSQKEISAFEEQLGGAYAHGNERNVFINPDPELTAQYKKEAAFTRAMALAQNPDHKGMFLTGPNTLWFVRQSIELHPEEYRDFLWRVGGVPESELAEILDSGYEQAADATGKWIKSFDRETPQEAPFLIQLIADFNPLMGIAKFISLVKDDKPLYAMPGTKATTLDWVEGWVGLLAAGEALFGDLLEVSVKGVKAIKAVKVGRAIANPTGKVSEVMVEKWTKECLKDEVVKKLIADIIAMGIDKGLWDGVIRNVDKAVNDDKKNNIGAKASFQRKASSEPATSRVPPIVQDALRLEGQPLDARTREFMEPRFNHDFSGVRVHTDAPAAQSAHAVDALAFTMGQDIVFARGQYAPRTPAGGRLLAHELTHVVQQQAGRVSGTQANGSSPAFDDQLEQEANEFGDKAARGEFINARTARTQNRAEMESARAKAPASGYLRLQRQKKSPGKTALRPTRRAYDFVPSHAFYEVLAHEFAYQNLDGVYLYKASQSSSPETGTVEPSPTGKGPLSFTGSLKLTGLPGVGSPASLPDNFAFMYTPPEMPPPIPEVGGAPPPLYYEAHQMPGSALLSKASGLVVYYLIPTKDTAPKIIAFRGTEPTASDIAADATPEGVGKSVFELHKKEIKSMLDKMTSSRGSKLVVVGHSLGGAMAQWTTAEFPGQINETVTFNSPGISREASKKFEKNSSAQKNKPEVFHYVTRGDIVSTSGQTPLPGKVTMMEGNATRKLEAMLERGAIRQINDALLSLLTAINILAQGEAGNSRLAVVAYILGKLYVSGVFDEFEEFGTLLGQLHSQRLLGVSELQAERSKNPLPRFASLSSLNKNVKPPATDLEELEQDAGHVIKTPKQVNQINIASIEKARVVLGKSGFIGDVYTLFNQTIPSISILKKNLAKTVGMEVSNVSVLAPIAKQVQPLLTKLVIVVYGFGGLQSFVQKALYYQPKAQPTRGVAEPDKTGVASPLIDEKLIQRSSPR